MMRLATAGLVAIGNRRDRDLGLAFCLSSGIVLGTITQPVSVLMPVCDEAAVIEDIVREWEAEVFRYLPAGSELLFDDGASRDGTLERLERLRSEFSFIRILYSQRDGFGAAARRLYRDARCPLVFFTDSDGQYVAREFWKVAAVFGACDLAHGVKLNRQDPLYRRIASAGFNRLARHAFDIGIGDINSAFRLLSKSMVDDLLPRVHCMPTLLNAEFLLRAVAVGYSVRQVDVAHRPRAHAKSRGLPASRFARECLWAYCGLAELRRELRAPAPVRLVSAPAPESEP
jgi:glycosyltransferase involved in cell wall biosynthesis